MSDSPRGGRRPGAGRKPGSGTGSNPEIRERVPADLADYCKAQQAANPGFLARLIKQYKENSAMFSVSLITRNPQTDLVEETTIGSYADQNKAMKAAKKSAGRKAEFFKQGISFGYCGEAGKSYVIKA